MTESLFIKEQRLKDQLWEMRWASIKNDFSKLFSFDRISSSLHKDITSISLMTFEEMTSFLNQNSNWNQSDHILCSLH